MDKKPPPTLADIRANVRNTLYPPSAFAKHLPDVGNPIMERVRGIKDAKVEATLALAKVMRLESELATAIEKDWTSQEIDDAVQQAIDADSGAGRAILPRGES